MVVAAADELAADEAKMDHTEQTESAPEARRQICLSFPT